MINSFFMRKKNLYIGLKYRPNLDNAPRVLFKIYSNLSDIINVFDNNGIPVYKDPILLSILEQLPVGKEIPEELYLIIAKIYRVLYKNGYIQKKNG